MARPDDMENPILSLIFCPAIFPFLPTHIFAISLAESSQSDILLKGTVRAFFQGFPMHLPILHRN